MPPTDFLARPESWLRAMHRHRGTLSAGPNFAYEMCAARIDAAALAGLDLSSWRVAFNGAEPVSPDTIARFNERFAAYGFDARAQFPVYGLAECAVGLAFPPVFRGALVDRVDRRLLAGTGIATPARADDADALRLVACGRPLPGHEIRIVDAGGHELPERHEGRIEFRGPSATSGYFRNPEATRALFDGDWLATGDLGYVAGGELYLTGRAKDLIIRGGQHIHPQEAEAAIGGIRGVRKGCVTVFGVPDRAAGTEKVVVLAETRESDPGRREALRAAIAALGLALLGAPPDDIVLAPPHTVLKTSSGKIRRAACSDLYQRGALRPGSRRLWPQLARLGLIGAAASVRRGFGAPANSCSASMRGRCSCRWCWPSLILVSVLPRPAWRRRAATVLARAYVAASRLPMQVEGGGHFPPTGPLIVAANHASYIDGLVLLAVVPERCEFVAKQELARSFPMRARCCAASAPASSSASMSRAAWVPRRRWPRRPRRAHRSSSSRKGRCSASPGCARSAWARSSPRRPRARRSCRSRSAAPGRCCATGSGGRAPASSGSSSRRRSRRTAATGPPPSACASAPGRRSSRPAANPMPEARSLATGPSSPGSS